MKVQQLLEQMLASEINARVAYEDLWRRYENRDDELAALWQKMAYEEAQHANLIRMVRDKLSSAVMAEEVELDIAPVIELARRIEVLRLVLIDPDPPTDELLEAVLDVEEVEQLEVIASLLETGAQPFLANLYQSLRCPAEHHVEGLLRVVRRRAARRDLRRRAAKLVAAVHGTLQVVPAAVG